MSAPTIRQILDGITVRLKTISGLQVLDVWPGQNMGPCAVLGVPAIDNYRLTMRRGTFDLNPTVTALVPSSVADSGQRLLADFSNPTGDLSFLTAIEGDKTLGGVVASCHVESFRPLGSMDEVGAIGYFGGLFTLYVAAEGGT